MSIDLFVIRHAIAFDRDEQRWSDDRDRPLTPEGERSFRRAARGLRAVAKSVDVVLASPYARAWRTAELLSDEAGWPEPRPLEALEADRSAEDALAALAAWPESGRFAVVGHEPMLSRLCSILIGGGALELKKGTAVRLEADELAPGGARLGALLPPKVLRRLKR